MTKYERNVVADLLIQLGYDLTGGERGRQDRCADTFTRAGDLVRVEYRLTQRQSAESETISV